MGCPKCEPRFKELLARVDELERKLADALEKLAKATKNSANNSKPPSSDIVKPIRPRRSPGERKKGGQKGHKRVVRPVFADDELDWLTQHSCQDCPCCGGPVTVDTDSPVATLQRVDVVSRTEITEHQALSCHASFATIWMYLSDVYQLKLSRGMLAKVIAKFSEVIAPLYESLFGALKVQRILWTWCFRGSQFSVFRVGPSRGSGVLLEAFRLNSAVNVRPFCFGFSDIGGLLKGFGEIPPEFTSHGPTQGTTVLQSRRTDDNCFG